jgi:hypothetical protein
MIAAIEGLIPDRRSSPSGTKPAAPPVEPDIYNAKWLRKQQHQAAGEEPGDVVAAAEAPPDAPQVSGLEPAPNPAIKLAADAPPPPPDRTSDRNQPSLADTLIQQGLNWVPLATGGGFQALLDSINSPRQPFSIKKGPFGRRR